MILSQKNKHPRDERIVFHEHTHTYEVDGSSDGIISVTTFIHSFFPHFNADLVLKKMKNKKEKYPGLTDHDIKKMWEESGKVASQQGTNMHKQIELFYNDELAADVEKSKEFHHFLRFQEEWIKPRGYLPYRTEWSIFDGEIDLAGQLDMLYQKKEGVNDYALYDWKRIKEIKTDNPYEKGHGIVSQLPHCNFSHYSLQLNIYKKILSTRYGINVSEMYLVILHPDNDTYITVEVKDMTSTIDQLFNHRYHSIRQE